MSNACHYAMNEVKMGVNVKKVSLKYVQAIFQKTITLPIVISP